MQEEEFYVGYLERGKKTRSFLKKVTIGLGALVVLGALAFALGQDKFGNGTFELGSITEIEGVLHEMPYPLLRMTTAEGFTKDVLLLGFGKWGAEGTLDEIAAGKPINGMRIKLKGTLIYSEGRTLFQLQPDPEGNFELVEQTQDHLTISSQGEQKLQGEIIDPKCYFGVMKPGRGKIHRSCAIRCISGGIPPVFLTTDKEGYAEYYLITDRNDAPANQQLLEHVGKPSSVTGEVVDLGDWKQIKIDCDQIEDLDMPSTVY